MYTTTLANHTMPLALFKFEFSYLLHHPLPELGSKLLSYSEECFHLKFTFKIAIRGWI